MLNQQTPIELWGRVVILDHIESMNEPMSITELGRDDGRYILDLSSVTRTDLAKTGGKAANLGDLRKSGFRVPDGYVLTTEAFVLFLRENQLEGTSGDIDAESVRLPTAIATALSEISRGLGDVNLAVRSSAVNEDLQDSSFAGQYTTVLGVRGHVELLEAVKKCWLSIFGRTVGKYREQRASGTTGEMGVLVQKLVNADSAGVAFTVNPVSGEKEVVVNAVRGLGEKLVSGSAIPDEWIVRESPVCVSKGRDVLTEAQVKEIAQLARRVEEHFGSPQDIEWAIETGKIFLLQARPITTLQKPKKGTTLVPIPLEVPEGYWVRDRYHFLNPTSPMYASFAFTIMRNAIRQGRDDIGFLDHGSDFRLIGGYFYRRVVPRGGRDRDPPPVWLQRLRVHLGPSTRSRVRKMRDAVTTDLAGRYMMRWKSEWKPEIMKKSGELLKVDLASLSDNELDSHLGMALEHMRRGKEIHFRYLGFTFWNVGNLAVNCQNTLKWNEAQIFNLLSGLSETDTEPSKRLSELARLVKNDTMLEEAIRRASGSSRIDEILAISPVFREQFRLYMKDFGAASLGYESTVPTLAEKPLELLKLIQGQISTDYNPAATAAALERKRNAATDEALKQLDSLPGDARKRFTQILERAQAAYGLRNENEFYTHFLPEGILRYAILEIGKRLVAKKMILERDDIFMVTLVEARDAFREGKDLRELVEKRWGERKWAEANPGPPSYGTRPKPPSIDVYPPEVRELLQSQLWLGKSVMTRVEQKEGGLKGVPASPGVYIGPVRVVMNESEFEKIRPGDVLVCPNTAPSWSVVFSNIGALVTETGGVLSHPAIVAREYGIPAVLALDDATKKLKDGTMVEVNGNSGMIKTL